jgi:hypothetical protein
MMATYHSLKLSHCSVIIAIRLRGRGRLVRDESLSRSTHKWRAVSVKRLTDGAREKSLDDGLEDISEQKRGEECVWVSGSAK